MSRIEELANAITIMIKNFERETNTRVNTIRVVKENKKTKYVKIKLLKKSEPIQ